MRKFNRLSFIKRPKIVIPLIIALILMGLVFIAFKNLNGPAEGTVTTQSQEISVSAIKGTPTPRIYSDKFISFQYPSKYESEPPTQRFSGTDSISLVKIDRRDQFASIGVSIESLDNDSGITYRQLHPELYKKVSSSIDSIVFEKIDHTEYTGYIQHNSQVISISFTSVSGTDLSGDYKVVADSLKWRK